jgi:hypothetical protein
MTAQVQADAYGPGDYDDNIVLVREFSEQQGH